MYSAVYTLTVHSAFIPNGFKPYGAFNSVISQPAVRAAVRSGGIYGKNAL